ncbi:MAG: nucleotidyltransferase [Myxococcota bacterium]|nr:nucleotidyltransferase [Myxococcota bacterium]
MAESADAWLSDPEIAFLRALDAVGVRYLLVGMSAAILQGVPGTTQDVDLWFESLADHRIGEVARQVGGFWATRMNPPMLGGLLSDRFDVVVRMSGLEDFDSEYARARTEVVSGVAVKVLPLERIVVSKRAAGRPKDALAVRLIEDALAVLRHPASGSD